jgi:2-polyprenyl-3-methyl-5-hydroxy-6-metoxy-1,4-benzoquinol methylase
MTPAVAEPDAMARLQAMSTSPHPPEPPQPHPVVTAVVRAAGAIKGSAVVTPHMHGGSPEERVEWEYRNAETFWEALRGGLTGEVLRGKDVADVGCGWGGKSIYYAHHHGLNSLRGFDLPGIFDPAVADAFARGLGLDNCAFSTGLAEAIPYGDEEFDVAILDDVLEHVRDPEQVLRECHRILRPGGTVIARFPSIRMMGAHHFDRVVKAPGLHYLLGMRSWAGGFNHCLVSGAARHAFEPFSAVGASKHHPEITANLNGIDFSGFREVVARSSFTAKRLDMVGYPRSKFERKLGAKGRPINTVYERLRAVPRLREFLSMSIVFVGERR